MVFDWKYMIKTLVVIAATVVIAILLMNLIEISSIISLMLEATICVVVYISLSFSLKLTKVFF